jgi:hypothetical protein
MYGAHYDSLPNESPRVATVIFYLNNDTSLLGGETAFTEVCSEMQFFLLALLHMLHACLGIASV